MQRDLPVAVLIESIWKNDVLDETTVPLSNCTAGSKASKVLQAHVLSTPCFSCLSTVVTEVGTQVEYAVHGTCQVA